MGNKKKKAGLELVTILREAQEHMQSAVDLLKDYVAETGDEYAKSYLLDHLIIMTSADHSFLSSDLNMDELVERVREEYGDEE